VFDLYGNVWEWTSSVVNVGIFSISDWDGSNEAYIIQRGAAWDSALQRITQICLSQPPGSDPATGFRCVSEDPP
jgi:formylglycine-generating enzyme required for sulfatase activity